MSLLARAQAFLVSLPDRPLLDRVVRGRAWIPILGVLLAGIVAMQVEVLKLNASMGRSLERGTALASRNQQLRASVSALSDDARIERLAAQQGMVMPAPEAVTFLNSADGRRRRSGRPQHPLPRQPGLHRRSAIVGHARRSSGRHHLGWDHLGWDHFGWDHLGRQHLRGHHHLGRHHLGRHHDNGDPVHRHADHRDSDHADHRVRRDAGGAHHHIPSHHNHRPQQRGLGRR